MNWYWFAGQAFVTCVVYIAGFVHGVVYMRAAFRKLMKTAEFGKMYTFTAAVQQQAEWMNKTGGTVDEAAASNLRKAFHDEHASEADHPSAEAGDDGTGSE